MCLSLSWLIANALVASIDPGDPSATHPVPADSPSCLPQPVERKASSFMSGVPLRPCIFGRPASLEMGTQWSQLKRRSRLYNNTSEVLLGNWQDNIKQYTTPYRICSAATSAEPSPVPEAMARKSSRTKGVRVSGDRRSLSRLF